MINRLSMLISTAALILLLLPALGRRLDVPGLLALGLVVAAAAMLWQPRYRAAGRAGRSGVMLGTVVVLGALLWARDIRRNPLKAARGYRGPWIMGGIGAAVFVLYLLLVTRGAFGG